MNFCHGSHCASRIAISYFLLNGYSGWNTIYKIHVWLLHTSQKLSSVRTQTLYITPLTFGKQCVEGQRRLAATAHTRYDYQLVAWYIYRDVFQIMRTCSVNMYYILIQLSIVNCQIFCCQTIHQLFQFRVIQIAIFFA